jgi:hypothetical protein
MNESGSIKGAGRVGGGTGWGRQAKRREKVNEIKCIMPLVPPMWVVAQA